MKLTHTISPLYYVMWENWTLRERNWSKLVFIDRWPLNRGSKIWPPVPL